MVNYLIKSIHFIETLSDAGGLQDPSQTTGPDVTEQRQQLVSHQEGAIY